MLLPVGLLLWSDKNLMIYTGNAIPGEVTRAGVLVLSTRTRCTRVLNFLYSYFTRTRKFQNNSTRTWTRTRGQVLMYSYEYWHEYWYSMVHLGCKSENHHTWNKQFDLPWIRSCKFIYFVMIWKYDTCDVISNSITSFNSIIIKKLTESLLIMMFMFIVLIRPSPF